MEAADLPGRDAFQLRDGGDPPVGGLFVCFEGQGLDLGRERVSMLVLGWLKGGEEKRRMTYLG